MFLMILMILSANINNTSVTIYIRHCAALYAYLSYLPARHMLYWNYTAMLLCLLRYHATCVVSYEEAFQSNIYAPGIRLSSMISSPFMLTYQKSLDRVL
jgi:hypothetical protein